MVVDKKNIESDNIADIKAGKYGTQRDIATRLNIQRKTVQRWYKNNIPGWAVTAIMRNEDSQGSFIRRDGRKAFVPAGYEKLSTFLEKKPGLKYSVRMDAIKFSK